VETNANAELQAGGAARGERASAILRTLSGLEAELRGAAIFGSGDEVVASTVEDPAWQQAAADLLSALRASADGLEGDASLDSSHVATDEAEVFVVTEGDFSLVAVTARFVLASLTAFDMRMSLRDLAAADA
jgi:hypothetical protein